MHSDLENIFSQYHKYNSNYRISVNSKTQMPLNFDYKRNTMLNKPYDYVVYTNGCSWIASKYLDDILDTLAPNALHINRSKAGQGNLQIIDKTIRDIDYFKSLNIPVYAFISFTEVGRNKEEFYLANPNKYESLTEYLKQILICEHNELNSALSNQNIAYHVTTSFCTNCFNSNKSIVNICGDFHNYDIYAVAPGIIEYMRDRNTIFKFDTEQYVQEIEKINNYLNAMASLDWIDDTYHPTNWRAYSGVVEFLDNNKLL